MSQAFNTSKLNHSWAYFFAMLQLQMHRAPMQQPRDYDSPCRRGGPGGAVLGRVTDGIEGWLSDAYDAVVVPNRRRFPAP